MHASLAVCAAEALMGDDLVELTDGTGESALPDEEKVALFNTNVIFDGNQQWIVDEFTLTFGIALVAHMGRVALVRFSKAHITLAIDDIKTTAEWDVKWTHVLDDATEVFEHAVIVHLVQVLNRVQVGGAIE